MSAGRRTTDFRARPAATKTVPRERLAQRRGGAEKDQEEKLCMVFSVSLRLCASARKNLRGNLSRETARQAQNEKSERWSQKDFYDSIYLTERKP
jgi:hypothetical protein